jgi:two-component system alkaline phosphatase synthesis response regulator PhoP
LGAQSQENSNYIEIGDLILIKIISKYQKEKKNFYFQKEFDLLYLLLLIQTKFSKEKKSLKKFGEMM